MSSQGGKARSSVLTPEQRKEIAQKAIRTRWAKAKGIPIEEVGQQAETVLRQTDNGSKQRSRPDTLLVSKEGNKRVSLFKGDVHFGNIAVPCHVLNDGNRVIAQWEVIKALTGHQP